MKKKSRLFVKKIFNKGVFISIQNKDFRSPCSNGSYSVYVNFSNLKSLIFFLLYFEKRTKIDETPQKV